MTNNGYREHVLMVFRHLFHRYRLRKNLIFLHIPKTGGTSFNRVIDRNVHPSRIYHALGLDAIDAFRDMRPSERRKYSCVEGHITFGWHRHLDAPATYATFLRHPVERIVSFYIHALSRRDHYLYPVINRRPTQPMPIEQFVQSWLTVEMNNGHVRLLSTEDGKHDFRVHLDERDLEKAKKHLDEHFDFIGIMEQYDASLALARKVLGFIDVRTIGKANTAIKRYKQQVFENMDRDLISFHLSKRNKLDFALYEHAKSRFEELLREHGISTDYIERTVGKGKPRRA